MARSPTDQQGHYPLICRLKRFKYSLCKDVLSSTATAHAKLTQGDLGRVDLGDRPPRSTRPKDRQARISKGLTSVEKIVARASKATGRIEFTCDTVLCGFRHGRTWKRGRS